MAWFEIGRHFFQLKMLLLNSELFSNSCQKHHSVFLKFMATVSKVEGCAFRFSPFLFIKGKKLVFKK